MSARKIAVLLVGKGVRNAPTLEDHLVRRGCEVYFATSIKESLRLFQIRHFDLVLSEFLLSDGTAYRLHPRLLGTDTTMFISNAVEDGCWWMTALFEGQDRLGEPGMRPSEFTVRLDEFLYDKLFSRAHKPVGAVSSGLINPSLGFDSATSPSVASQFASEQTATWNHELAGSFVIALLCLAAFGVFLFGVLSKTEPAANGRPLAISPATHRVVGAVEERVKPPPRADIRRQAAVNHSVANRAEA